LLDHLVHRRNPVGVDQEQCQERPLLWGPCIDSLPAELDVERPEYRESD
jgi:hypothetical protein